MAQQVVVESAFDINGSAWLRSRRQADATAFQNKL
jgi:hypothetical protein